MEERSLFISSCTRRQLARRRPRRARVPVPVLVVVLLLAAGVGVLLAAHSGL